MTGLDYFTQIALRATVLLAAGLAGAWLLRRGSAALRHSIWSATLIALLLLPFASAVAPKWGWRSVQQTVVTVRRGRVRIASVPAAPVHSPYPYGLILVWSAGFGVVALRFAIGAIRTGRMVRRAIPVEGAPAGLAPVFESADAPMPLVWGVRRPSVVLPLEARGWTADRLRTVLLHEWMHVERRDLLAQAAGQAACCLYWFHPLVWLAARHLRKERERACDDAVLMQGIPAHDYAAHLVDLVRAMAARKAQWASAVGMAERSDLEARVRDLLDRHRPRHPLTRRAALTVGAAAMAILAPLAVLNSYAQATRGSLSGVVKDPSGAVVPNCDVTAKNLDGSNQEVTRTDMVGEYQFASVPPGHYEVSVHAPGFSIFKVTVAVTAGVATRMDANMSIGSTNSVVTVTASGRRAVSPTNPRASNPQRIAVGGNVQAARLLTQQRPVYPEDAKAQGVEGRVLIQAIISKTGEVMSPRVTNTDIDPRLAKAALDAVSQWHYAPTLLNGMPVETLNTIEVEFSLDQ